MAIRVGDTIKFRTEDGGTQSGEVSATSAFEVLVTVQYAERVWGHWVPYRHVVSTVEQGR